MPNKRITDLATHSTLDGTELIEVVDQNEALAVDRNKKTTVYSELVASVQNSASYAYFPTFQAGSIAFHGPNAELQFSGQFILSLALPNPSGIPCPALMIGGAEQERVAVLTDAQVPGQKGIDMIIAAGESDASGTSNGGDLLTFGGGSFGGTGGMNAVQGGTSFNGAGGMAILRGGNATNSLGTRGDAVVQGGEDGNGGGNVHIIATYGTGSDGEIRFRANSDLLLTMNKSGAMFFKSDGAGLAGQPLVSRGTGNAPQWATNLYTGDIVIGGTTIHVASGLITGIN